MDSTLDIDKIGKIYNRFTNRWVFRNSKPGKNLIKKNVSLLKDTEISGFIKNYINIQTFTKKWIGTPLNEFMSIFYLMNKYGKECFVLIPQTEEELKLSGNLGFVWNAEKEKLLVPKMILKILYKCIDNNNIRFIIIPLTLEYKESAHANFLIIDKYNKEIVHFEPYGYLYSKLLEYNEDKLYTVLENTFMKIFKKYNYEITTEESSLFSSFYNMITLKKQYIYKRPIDVCPAKGLQYIESEAKNIPFIDSEGYCSVWSLFFVDIKLTYPNIENKKLIKKILFTLDTNPILLKQFIYNYSQFLLSMKNRYSNPEIFVRHKLAEYGYMIPERKSYFLRKRKFSEI